jgi:hypothetical protein
VKMIVHFLFAALVGAFSSIGFSAPNAQMTNISGHIQGAGYTTIEIGVNGKGGLFTCPYLPNGEAIELSNCVIK